MTKLLFLLTLSLLLISCNQDSSNSYGGANPMISSITEENYDLRNDSTIFNSATIENFDLNGNSIDVYWIGIERDTTLRFYRKYDANMNLIGAEYYEPGDVEANRDTVYTNEKGLKVEASLNAEGNISWKSITTTDESGNPVLKTYENGKGEYRGLDSLYFDDMNRVVKGFYENSTGKRYGIRTYEYLATDEFGNWTERNMYRNAVLAQKQVRILSYHETD